MRLVERKILVVGAVLWLLAAVVSTADVNKPKKKALDPNADYVAPKIGEFVRTESKRRGWGDPFLTMCDCSPKASKAAFLERLSSVSSSLPRIYDIEVSDDEKAEQDMDRMRFEGKSTDDLMKEFDDYYGTE